MASSSSPPSARARGSQMRTAMRVVPEQAPLPPEGIWQEHLHALWSQMTKEELETEVQWRTDDQMVLLETIENLKAELKKKDKEIKRSEEEVLRQYKVIDRQRAYIDSLHLLMQRPQ